MAADPKIPERASRKATDWLILLQEEPDDPEARSRFADWLSAHPENAAAWEATVRASALVEAAPPAHAERWRPFVEQTRNTVGAEPPPATRPRPARRRAIRLTALAAAACLALLFLPDLLIDFESDYRTGTGETRTVTLEDGSTVVLAPESALAVAFGPAERRVDLLAGEVFFEAAADAGRPFRVGTRAIETTVVGTAFDIRRGSDGVTVAVAHGTVAVDHPQTVPPVAERLEAGQSLALTWSGALTRGTTPPGRIAAWRDRQLIAQDEPLGAVIDQLRRYYEGTIIVAGGDLAERPVTGVYNLSDAVDAVRGVAEAHGATVHRITPWLLVVSGR